MDMEDFNPKKGQPTHPPATLMILPKGKENPAKWSLVELATPADGWKKEGLKFKGNRERVTFGNQSINDPDTTMNA